MSRTIAPPTAAPAISDVHSGSPRRVADQLGTRRDVRSNGVADDRLVAAGRDDITGSTRTRYAGVVDDRLVAAGRHDITGPTRTRYAGVVDDRLGATGRDD